MLAHLHKINVIICYKGGYKTEVIWYEITNDQSIKSIRKFFKKKKISQEQTLRETKKRKKKLKRIKFNIPWYLTYGIKTTWFIKQSIYGCIHRFIINQVNSNKIHKSHQLIGIGLCCLEKVFFIITFMQSVIVD